MSEHNFGRRWACDVAKTAYHLITSSIINNVEKSIGLPLAVSRPHSISTKRCRLNSYLVGSFTSWFGPSTSDGLTAAVTSKKSSRSDGLRLCILPPQNPLKGDVGRMAEVHVKISHDLPQLWVYLQPLMPPLTLCLVQNCVKASCGLCSEVMVIVRESGWILIIIP